jgi:hypothetical protein
MTNSGRRARVRLAMFLAQIAKVILNVAETIRRQAEQAP